MSIPVSLEELSAVFASYPWGYLVTVGEDGRAHSLAVPTDFRDGVLHADAGRSTRRNAAARANVTVVFPHPEPGRYSLIIDGEAQVGEHEVVVSPTHAILHRPAIPVDGV